LVYDSLIDELEIEFNEEELLHEDEYDDYYKDDDTDETDENW